MKKLLSDRRVQIAIGVVLALIVIVVVLAMLGPVCGGGPDSGLPACS